MARRRNYYVHDVDGNLVYEDWTTYGSSNALDWAEQEARLTGKSLVVTNDEGRALARFDGTEYTYLGY